MTERPNHESDHEMNPPAAGTPRRRAVLGIAAVAGVALTAGASLWQSREARGRQEAGASSPVADAQDPVAALLGLEFEGLRTGETVRLSAWRGRPLLINFWASWCAPCIKEMPLLDRFHQERQAARPPWQVIGLAVDTRDNVQKFLDRQSVGFPIALAGGEGLPLARSLGNDRGGLPFTILLDASGALVQKKLGETTSEDLAQWTRQFG